MHPHADLKSSSLHYLAQAAQAPTSWIAGVIGALWAAVAGGTIDGLLVVVLVLLISLDVITGVTASWVEGKQISSSAMRETVGKALGYFATIAAVAWGMIGLSAPPEAKTVIVAGVVMIFIYTEVLSVIENGARLGVPKLKGVVKFLRGRIKQLDEDPQKPESE